MMALLVGGPSDGQRVDIDHRANALTVVGEDYIRVDLQQDSHELSLFARWSVDKKAMLRMLIDGYADAPMKRDAKRWRAVEHSMMHVGLTPIGGDPRTFDPRDVHQLLPMRTFVDATLR